MATAAVRWILLLLLLLLLQLVHLVPFTLAQTNTPSPPQNNNDGEEEEGDQSLSFYFGYTAFYNEGGIWNATSQPESLLQPLATWMQTTLQEYLQQFQSSSSSGTTDVVTLDQVTATNRGTYVCMCILERRGWYD
jgi:hypothetical protein